jgi:hypothetical protein
VHGWLLRDMVAVEESAVDPGVIVLRYSDSAEMPRGDARVAGVCAVRVTGGARASLVPVLHALRVDARE